MYLRFGVTVAATLVTFAAVPARAQPGPAKPAEVEAVASEAARLYEEGKFEESIAQYLKAYQLAPAAALLYNIAYIYDRKLNELDLAIDFYRRYVKSPDADPEVVGRATARLRELKALQAERTVPPGGTDRTPPIVDSKDKVTGTASTTTTTGMSGRRIAGWAVLGGGGAIAATGVALALVARNTQRDFKAEPDLGRKINLRDAGKKQALAADILMSAGGAAMVAGVVLLVLPENRNSAREGAVGLAPALLGSGAIVTYRGHW